MGSGEEWHGRLERVPDSARSSTARRSARARGPVRSKVGRRFACRRLLSFDRRVRSDAALDGRECGMHGVVSGALVLSDLAASHEERHEDRRGERGQVAPHLRRHIRHGRQAARRRQALSRRRHVHGGRLDIRLARRANHMSRRERSNETTRRQPQLSARHQGAT